MFITDPSVIAMTQRLLHIVLWSTVLFGLAVVFSSMMRSSGTVSGADFRSAIFAILAVEVPTAMVSQPARSGSTASGGPIHRRLLLPCSCMQGSFYGADLAQTDDPGACLSSLFDSGNV
jgi:hypothetical protein